MSNAIKLDTCFSFSFSDMPGTYPVKSINVLRRGNSELRETQTLNTSVFNQNISHLVLIISWMEISLRF